MPDPVHILREVRQTPVPQVTPKKSQNVPFFSFPMRKRLLSCIDLCLLYYRSSGAATCCPEFFFLSLSGLHASKAWRIVSVLQEGETEASILGSPLKCQNTGHMIPLFLPREKPEAGSFLPIGWQCVREREYQEEVTWIFLLASMWSVSHSPGVQEPLNLLTKETGACIIELVSLWKEGLLLTFLPSCWCHFC